MANKTVSITTIPTRSDSDTVASYNVYTDKPSANTLVGTLTPAEALAGKILVFADGLNHNSTAKTVWTTAGESTTNVSNIVVVDLSTLLQDDFTGTTIDSTKWTVNDNGDGFVVISQNEELKFFSDGLGTSSSANHDIRSNDTFDISTTKVFSIDFKTTVQDYSGGWGFGFGVDFNDSIRFLAESSGAPGNIKYRVKTAGVDDLIGVFAIDASIFKTLKIVILSNLVTFYYWNGSAWVSIDSISKSLSGMLNIYISQGGNISGAATSIYDNIYLTNADYSTQYPI